VREVAGLLERYRLVTVAGPGGAGKTRLAGEVARRVAGRFADGAWLVELAAVQAPAQVPSAVAVALGVRERPGVSAAEAVIRVLARQQLLLVLDNCEHVIGAAAELCAGLQHGADDVRILATSREQLRAAGEARYRLAPLSLPDPDDQAGAGGSEAVALFADRARRADARFSLDRQSGPAVGRLVTRLDGMPLAIELAAARVEALGVTQLLDRLEDRFTLLAGGDRLAAARHRSLAATVEWSYQLLDDRERRVFRLVSVFPGPFTLEAAEAVAGEGAGPAVLQLVDCSLLSPPQAGPDGRSRYQMLETLRAYGSRLLAEAGEQDAAAAALAGYAPGVAGRAAAGLQTSTAEEVAAARWVGAEDAAMRQVLAWAMDHDPAVAVRLVAALGWWWLVRGRLPGQYGLLRRAAGRAEEGSDGWCAVQFWILLAAVFSADPAGALDASTTLMKRGSRRCFRMRRCRFLPRWPVCRRCSGRCSPRRRSRPSAAWPAGSCPRPISASPRTSPWAKSRCRPTAVPPYAADPAQVWRPCPFTGEGAGAPRLIPRLALRFRPQATRQPPAPPRSPAGSPRSRCRCAPTSHTATGAGPRDRPNEAPRRTAPATIWPG
jgi:predicted ATPase